MNDAALKQNVVDELDFEPMINATHIGVAVEKGIVTLTGHVDTYAQKLAAENVVAKIKGVKGIAEEIEVRPSGVNRTADDDIAKRAVNALTWNVVIPDGTVKVKVESGHVTLTGKVEWHYQRLAASDAVQALAGVRYVTNSIEVTPRASVVDVKKRIEDALKRNAEVEAKRINVEVTDGKVTLDGQVDTWLERNAAERAAWAAPGVRTVVDHIRVS
jgi:osmotically-inducible protein OsmY